MEENASSINKSIYYTKFRYAYCPYFNIQHMQPSKKHERPSRVMTKVTITNIKDHHMYGKRKIW
jgi:hypothetical protein